MDTSSLSRAEKIRLIEELNKSLKQDAQKEIAELRQKIRKLIADAHLSLEEVLKPMLEKAGDNSGKTLRKPAAVKYRLGENTWTGKGKQPRWLVEFINGGGRLEEIAV